jgi:hypothetical protein
MLNAVMPYAYARFNESREFFSDASIFSIIDDSIFLWGMKFS